MEFTDRDLHVLSDLIRRIIKEELASWEDSQHRSWGVEEACQFLRISKSTLYHMTAENRIPHMKSGKGLVFSPARLRDWAEKKGAA